MSDSAADIQHQLQHQLQLLQADVTNGEFPPAAAERIQFLLDELERREERICDLELDLDDANARVDELEDELEAAEDNGAK